MYDPEGSEVVAGSFATRAGGGIELAADGSFRYTPPGSPGAFWGDDLAEYEVAGEPPARARVRLTVAAPAFDLANLSARQRVLAMKPSTYAT